MPGSVEIPDGGGVPRSIADSLTSREWEQLVDIVVRRLERRVSEDLQRRGRHSVPRPL